MSSTEQQPLSEEERGALLGLARAAIRSGLEQGRRLEVAPGTLPPRLARPGAAFVTLQRHGALRGCIGSLEARQSLARDVAENAFNAAFRDPRFPPLQQEEFGSVRLSISVLKPAEPLAVTSEENLLRQLRPGQDGLILELDDSHRATFLPAVWDSLPEPRRFVAELKRKAGLPADFWSPALRFYRYGAETVKE
ncbi:MAG TPA: AmmeMemoRadiSam system protein A [Gammaproteobacteria bacterium]|nr:AmmeMemoRadiSam system protein A [Gammaproteobacteria bacterium]